jgi:hypothetical protein
MGNLYLYLTSHSDTQTISATFTVRRLAHIYITYRNINIWNGIRLWNKYSRCGKHKKTRCKKINIGHIYKDTADISNVVHFEKTTRNNDQGVSHPWLKGHCLIWNVHGVRHLQTFFHECTRHVWEAAQPYERNTNATLCVRIINKIRN